MKKFMKELFNLLFVPSISPMWLLWVMLIALVLLNLLN